MSYRVQYERMNRWYERFKEITAGKLHVVPSDYYEDDVYAFFLNCYHLKDWIKNDPALNLSKEVEKFINDNDCMRICADICNGLKHLRRNSDRSGKDPKFGKQNVYLHVGTAPTTISVSYLIDTKDAVIDAFQLATDCVTSWEDFVKAKIP